MGRGRGQRAAQCCRGWRRGFIRSLVAHQHRRQRTGWLAEAGAPYRQTVEAAEARLAQNFAPWVLASGIKVESISAELARLRVPFSAQLCRIGGILCGQALSSAADTAMVLALAATNGGFKPCTTVDLTMNYMRPISQADALLEAKLMRLGKNLAFASARGKPVAPGPPQSQPGPTPFWLEPGAASSERGVGRVPEGMWPNLPWRLSISQNHPASKQSVAQAMDHAGSAPPGVTAREICAVCCFAVRLPRQRPPSKGGRCALPCDSLRASERAP